MKRLVLSVFVLALIAVSAGSLSAAILVAVTVDENGNGSYTVNGGAPIALTAFLGQDPGPGGLNNVLIYSGLPLALVQGDLILTDGGVPGDVIRFNGDHTLAFYSDTPPFDALGDTPGPPTSFYTNAVSIPELGPEGNNGATYTPGSSQPGAGNSDFSFTYNIISDSVPEPGTLALIPLGLAAFGLMSVRRRRSRQ